MCKIDIIIIWEEDIMAISYADIQKVKDTVNKFQIEKGEITHVIVIDSGRINTTFKIVVTDENDTHSYMLQRINTNVFKNPYDVMNNAISVTSHIRAKGKVALEYVFTKDNTPLLEEEGYYYRMTKFIHAEVFQVITRPEDIKMLGTAVGDFVSLLSDFDATCLVDTIPNFHNTKDRYDNCILSALRSKIVNSDRVDASMEELEYVISNKHQVGLLVNALMSGEIPVRVTHNDTKVNNVLFDRKQNKPRCMIDLDTVMKGSVLYDLADAIRYGANTASEEEEDLSKVSIDLELYKAFLEGFAVAAPELLTEKEKELLPVAVKLMALELGMRFLTDYYDNDKYFAVSRERHNLDRAKVQFKLAQDIDAKFEQIVQIAKDVLN